jgi:hypothetical protein
MSLTDHEEAFCLQHRKPDSIRGLRQPFVFSLTPNWLLLTADF